MFFDILPVLVAALLRVLIWNYFFNPFIAEARLQPGTIADDFDATKLRIRV
ncbi:MAG TPA: hypothetical protein VKA92_12875 [Segetibacter sp.]|nr:hypothetical protein [Segetibacter sp.]